LDGQFCTIETCINPGPNGICSGSSPRDCTDPFFCNGTEVCDEARNLCEYACVGGTICDVGFCQCPPGGGGCPGGNIGQPCDPSVLPVNCSGGEVCNETLDDCTECFQNSHCTTAPELRCNVSTGVCVECTLNGHCDDGDFCSGVETCNAGTGFCEDGDDVECPFGQFCSELLNRCVQCENDAQCSDGLYCNGAETCVNDLCQSGTPVNCAAQNPATPFCKESTDSCVACLQNSHCNDGLFCTSDSCVFDACQHTPDPAEFCDDGIFCNGAENCNAGMTGCVNGTPPTCGKTCFQGINDGNACTADAQCGKVCSAGVNAGNSCTTDSNCGSACAGGENNGESCTLDDQCESQNCTAYGLCKTGVCRGGCSEQFDACVECASDVVGSTSCSDGLFCDGTETCNNTTHECQSVPRVACGQFDTECTKGFCNESTDVCTGANRPNGEICDDSNHCTRADECQSGVCVEDAPLANDPYRCVNLELQPGTTGTIGVGQTVQVNLRAISQNCNVAGNVGCPNSTYQRISGLTAILSWDPTKLQLKTSVAGDRNPQDFCDNSNPCFVCPAGQNNWGQSVFPFDCAGGDGLNAPCSGSTPMNDGNAFYLATALLQCTGGPPTCCGTVPQACVPPTGLNVTTFKFVVLEAARGNSASVSLLPCSGDVTLSQVVSNVQAPAGYLSQDVTKTIGGPVTFNVVSCSTAAQCNDNNLCTNDLCNAGTCSNPLKCPANADACTIESCNPANGDCLVTPVQCPPGERCYQQPGSTEGLCYPTCVTAANCNDGFPCTSEVCQAVTGDDICIYTPHDELCNTGNFCAAQYCNVDLGCVFDHSCFSSTGNPCPNNASCNEVTDSCGGCFAPAAVATGGRYLSVTPASQGATPIAIFVEGHCDDDFTHCTSGYVERRCLLGPNNGQLCASDANCAKACSGGQNNGQPCTTSANCPGGMCVGACDNARLVATPQYQTSAQWGTVYVRDTEVRPNAEYFVHAQCNFGGPPVLSAGKKLKTWKWGDTTGEGIVNAIDVARDVDCVKLLYANPVTYHGCNVWDCNVDNITNALDIAKVVDAVKGLSFGCPLLCP
jgi:hypothetical protein